MVERRGQDTELVRQGLTLEDGHDAML
jgi:hypothetical protein